MSALTEDTTCSKLARVMNSIIPTPTVESAIEGRDNRLTRSCGQHRSNLPHRDEVRSTPAAAKPPLHAMIKCVVGLYLV